MMPRERSCLGLLLVASVAIVAWGFFFVVVLR
jgi:hypothetical protein